MQTVKNTNIKHISKVREYESCDATDIIYDLMDWTRAESVKNGTTISRQKGSRRIIDRNRNAHTVDYSEFKVTKIESGVTVDNSKKEKQLEDAAISLLADLGISWDDDEEIEEEDSQEIDEPQTVSNESDNTVSNDESEDSQEMPDDFDSLLASIIGDTVENEDDDSDDEYDDPNQFTEEEMSALFDKLMADI